jgi:hypothetical protein
MDFEESEAQKGVSGAAFANMQFEYFASLKKTQRVEETLRR